ncbi:MAG: MotA/TolQ/ExbB proton channel family protein [Deltaproteobacteria bacterium]|jgi:biopolymer transport protein ExbB|nr:MotA/TolQ/ExbB proton channel family protein [Deltaproteobacteria bacterium]
MGAIVEAFKEGGWGMYPILLICIITFYLIVDRSMYLAKSKIDIEQLMSMIKSQIVAGNLPGAISTCDAQPVGATKIIAAGLRKAAQGGAEHDIQQAMDEEALRELPKIEKRTGYLAMLGNLATLAGLLGTITGLIKSFASVAGVDPSMKATMLSKGISEAMNCTAFGLGTGILGLAAFAVLNGKTQHILDGINQATVESLNLVVTGRGGAGR